MSGFRVVSDTSVETPDLTEAQRQHQQAAKWLVTALQVVSQRFTTAVALAWHTAFTAALTASAWWLWSDVIAAPSTLNIVAASTYSVFCLAVMYLRR